MVNFAINIWFSNSSKINEYTVIPDNGIISISRFWNYYIVMSYLESHNHLSQCHIVSLIIYSYIYIRCIVLFRRGRTRSILQHSPCTFSVYIRIFLYNVIIPLIHLTSACYHLNDKLNPKYHLYIVCVVYSRLCTFIFIYI